MNPFQSGRYSFQSGIKTFQLEWIPSTIENHILNATSTECKDPTFPPINEFYHNFLLNASLIENLEDPNTNTYYPPGTICAKEVKNQVCPTSGESGSPLMTQETGGFKRITTEGILSFIKGCSTYTFGRYQDNVGSTAALSGQLFGIDNAINNPEINTVIQISKSTCLHQVELLSSLDS